MTATSPESVLRVRAASLEVKRGPDAGRRARIDRPTFVVGTGEGADLRLTDTTVSREHLRISLAPGGVRLRDDGSKNGTIIGGLRIADASLKEDASIELGATLLALRLEKEPLELSLSVGVHFGGAIGVSPLMRHLFAALEKAAKSDATVLLEGESGVGKEVLARAIHLRSPRAKGPFVVVDCGAIPAALVEAELFGHERGAFTGASEARQGLLESANGGTVFLDEIGEMPLDLQPKLLRVLEQRDIRPIGARTSRPVDVRVVAATNRKLAEAARNGEFRQDLFYRLAVVEVTVPPLRDRPEDIEPLAEAFLRASTRDPAATLPTDLLGLLVRHSWPGNARELRNVIERYAVLGSPGLASDPRNAAGGADAGATPDALRVPFHEARRGALDAFERDYLAAALKRAGGNVARAAEIAQVGRGSLYRMLDRLGLSPRDD